jgi:hypothetical protein
LKVTLSYIRELGADDQITSLDISGLLLNICIALPDTGPPATATLTSTPSSSASPQPTKNAAAMIGFQPLQLLVVPFAAFGGLALL